MFLYIKVSRTGQVRVTFSQMVNTAGSCACGRAWLRFERDCAMMRPLYQSSLGVGEAGGAVVVPSAGAAPAPPPSKKTKIT